MRENESGDLKFNFTHRGVSWLPTSGRPPSCFFPKISSNVFRMSGSTGSFDSMTSDSDIVERNPSHTIKHISFIINIIIMWDMQTPTSYLYFISIISLRVYFYLTSIIRI